MTHYLLRQLKLDYYNRGRGADGLFGKIIYTLKADAQLYKYAKQHNPDIFISFGSPYAAHVSSLLGKPHIVIDDTENASIGQFMYKPFSDVILTPDCFSKDFGSKQIRFPSYMELSYLHPAVFNPDESIFEFLQINKNDKYCVVRFVGWGAVHDFGHTGLALNNKIKTVQEFSKYGRVFISSEDELPNELKKFELNIPKHRIHDVIAFSTMFFGESATMASESAVLGVPAIYLDNEGRGYTDEQENKYGLVYNFTESELDQQKAIAKGVEILSSTERDDWSNKRANLLNDKIDLTSFFEYFIENYPSSIVDSKKFLTNIAN
jgi:predicted glycosyltransferase